MVNWSKPTMLTIADVVHRTGASNRRLRYVLEHDLLELDDVVQPGRGVARLFDPKTAAALAVAALMLDAGLRRSAVIIAVRLLRSEPLLPVPRGAKPGLSRIMEHFSGEWIHRLDIGDGRFYRWHWRAPDRESDGRTGWRQVHEQQLHETESELFERAVRQVVATEPPEADTPLVTVSVDVEAVRAAPARGVSWWRYL